MEESKPTSISECYLRFPEKYHGKRNFAYLAEPSPAEREYLESIGCWSVDYNPYVLTAKENIQALEQFARGVDVITWPCAFDEQFDPLDTLCHIRELAEALWSVHGQSPLVLLQMGGTPAYPEHRKRIDLVKSVFSGWFTIAVERFVFCTKSQRPT